MKYPKVKNPDKLPGSWVRKAKKVSRKYKCPVTLGYDGHTYTFIFTAGKNEFKEMGATLGLYIRSEIKRLTEDKGIDQNKLQEALAELNVALNV